MPTEPIQPRFDILAEGTPQRCEICHQSDQFNPATGTCARCAAVPVPQASATFGTDVLRRFDIPERFRELVLREVGDEAVLWAGKPRGRQLFLDLIPELLLALVCIMVLVVMCGLKIFFLILFLLPVLFSLIFGEDFKNLLKSRRMLYVVTENRALILVAGRKTRVTSFQPDLIQKLVYERKPGDKGNLFFSCRTGENGEQPFDNGFYGIENVAEVERLIRKHLLSGK